MSDPLYIVDTVVLLYFLLVGQHELLQELVGDPIDVPLSVYDPDEREIPEEALRHSELLSEMRRSIRHYEAGVKTGTYPAHLLERVRSVDQLFERNHLRPIEMTDEERTLAALLASKAGSGSVGLRVPLGAGESACVAIASGRNITIVTDDDAALAALESLHKGTVFPYERIRKLLIRAADTGLISREEANAIHRDMRVLGFWDLGQPFT